MTEDADSWAEWECSGEAAAWEERLRAASTSTLPTGSRRAPTSSDHLRSASASGVLINRERGSWRWPHAR